MSKYTTEVRYICEHYAGADESVGYMDTREVISKARSHIFESDYPIFDEEYRSVLETKILRHFYTREIAAESVGLWKMWLNTRLNEIMPYYNQRYESEFIRFNPLYDTDLATSRDDKFGSQRIDINSNDIINGGDDIVNTHSDKNVSNSGSDLYTQGGNIKNERRGYDNEAYDDRDSADDDRTIENWKNSSTTDWHYQSDTPQSTIAQISDNNYATGFTKDVHNQTNTVDSHGDLTAPSENYEKTHDKVEHNNHNDTRNTYNSDSTDIYNKADVTAFGKETDTDFMEQQATTYGKTVHGDENKNRGFNSTDEWLEHIVGKRNNKSYSQMLNEFRTTFLNIDMEIINELNDLFFNLW